MKRTIMYSIMICILLTGCSYVGCGQMEKMKD